MKSVEIEGWHEAKARRSPSARWLVFEIRWERLAKPLRVQATGLGLPLLDWRVLFYPESPWSFVSWKVTWTWIYAGWICVRENQRWWGPGWRWGHWEQKGRDDNEGRIKICPLHSILTAKMLPSLGLCYLSTAGQLQEGHMYFRGSWGSLGCRLVGARG